MTYISSAQSIAKIYPTVLGSWLQQTWTRGGGGGGRGGGVEQRERAVREREREREREPGCEWVGLRLSKCWLGVCFGQTTEYTERENGLHSSSAEVQTALRSKFNYILCAQDDKTVKTHTHKHTHQQCSLGQTTWAGCQLITASSRLVPEFIQLSWWANM